MSKSKKSMQKNAYYMTYIHSDMSVQYHKVFIPYHLSILFFIVAELMDYKK